MMRRRYELKEGILNRRGVAAEQAARYPSRRYRRVLNGILWRFRIGLPWAEMPER